MGEKESLNGLMYVGRAAKSFVRKMGQWRLPSSYDWEDVAQETHAELARELGSDYGSKIDEAMAEGPDFKHSPIYKAILRCLGRAEGRLRMTKTRGNAARAAVSLADIADPAGQEEDAANLVGMAIDLAETLDQLSDEDQLMWDMMCRHKNITDVARKLGINHQKASTIKARIIDKMARRFRE